MSASSPGAQSDRGVRTLVVADTRIALGVSLVALACAVIGLVWSGWAHLPVFPRLLVGLVCFGFAPGLAALGFIHRGQPEEEPSQVLVNAVALTFSCNLVLNLVLFATHLSFHLVMVGYLLLQAAAYAVLVRGLRRGAPWAQFFQRRAVVRTSPAALAASALLALAWGGALYYTYNNAICGAPIEELVVLRKLADSAHVRYDAISFVKGEPSTYLFVPFQVLIVGVSAVSRLDVALVYPAFHAVTTLLGVAALLLLAREIFGDAIAVFVLAAVLMIGLATDLPGLLIDLGLVAPCPNRFGFAGGVLMPLALLMFFTTIKRSTHAALHWFLLVYLVVEMTFVHARETLFVLACMAFTSAVLVPRLTATRPVLKRVLTAIAATVLVLVAYKYVNLSLSAGLERYVGLLTQQSRAALAKLVHDRGVAGALIDPGPDYIDIVFPEVDLHVPHTVPSYDTNLRESWNRLYFPSRVALPLVMLGLPLFAWVAASRVELALAAVFSGAGLALLSGLLKLVLSSVVGNPEILYCYSLLYLVGFLLFGRMVALCASALARRGRNATIAGVAALGGLLVSIHVDAVRSALFAVWRPGLALALHGITLAIVAYRTTRDLPTFPPFGTPPPLAGRLAAVLVACFAVVPLVRVRPWEKWTLHAPYPPSRFSGVLVRDLPLLVESNRIQGGLPPPLIAFLREAVPPQQVVLGRNTVAVVASTSHFASLLTTANDLEVARSYICNWPYLLKHQIRPGPFQLGPYLGLDDDLHRLKTLLADLGVDLVIVGPDESPAVAAAWRSQPKLQELLENVYGQGGYAVYRVRRS